MRLPDRPPRVALLLCAGVGFAAGRLSRHAGSDARWFDSSNEMLVEASLDGYFLRLTDQWEETLGWTRAELQGRKFLEFVHPDDLAATAALASALDASPGEVIDFENRYRAKDGSWHWLQWRVRSDHRRKYAVARDVTGRRRLEQERQELLGRVEAMARTDLMTGLPNRRAWEEELRKAIERARRGELPLAVGLVDVDHFKVFNDTLGHPSGDALLADAAASWRLSLRVTDVLARYGGEEFGLLISGCPPGETAALLERFRAATPRGQTVSIGLAYWNGTETADELVARADAALYRAKDTGRDRVVTAVVVD